jgi:FkbM family methyltransferase
MAAFSWLRKGLNVVYLKLAPSQKVAFYLQYAKLFRKNYIRGSDGIWKVNFLNKRIRMPLSSENFWLDWDAALSLVGHDAEIKQTYEALIGSSEKPELFIDIGANYGTHSLLFLVNGIKTITFEPNSSCHGYFKKICELNHVIPTLEPVCLGDRKGQVKLSYPERETWLGSTNAEVIQRLSRSEALLTEKVEQRMVDDYMQIIGRKRALIKIDTEGNELCVLRGAIKTLQECEPMIIFECWNENERAKLFDFFDSQNYSICHLPWVPTNKVEPLTRERFAASARTNFMAIPASKQPAGQKCLAPS